MFERLPEEESAAPFGRQKVGHIRGQSHALPSQRRLGPTNIQGGS